MESICQNEVDLYAAIAGARGVIRELLEELRKSDTSNPLLDKKIRDRVFLSAFNEVGNKMIGTKPRQRMEKATEWRDCSYGAENANKSGPEYSQITPNLQIRAEAEVPSHVSDREMLIGLVERLTTDLKTANPNAPSLKNETLMELLVNKGA